MFTFKQMENLLKILKSLSDLNRLRIVMAIGKRSISVSEIIQDTDLPQTLVSFHLKALRNAEVVITERNGPFIYYSLFCPNLIDILSELSRINSVAASADEQQLETAPDVQ
jgi:DNA-binding transcriptional ArsR family regulator